MFKKIVKTTQILIPLLCLLFAINYLSAAMNSSNYQIWADTFSSGGGEDMSSDNYRLGETIGEIGIGNLTSTNYSVGAGYRQHDYFDGREVLTLTLGKDSLELGNLSKDTTGTDSHLITVDTNSSHGVSVVYSGNTLTCSGCSGDNTISAIGAGGAASSLGTSQFGFNVIYSTSTAPIPIASSLAPYNSDSSYAFSSGDEIINSSGDISETTFSVNYIANISGTEPSGTYATQITYTATANF